MHEIVLVTPPLTPKERYGPLASAANTMPSMGLLSVGAVIKLMGLDVKIIEASSLGLGFGDTLREILESSPKILGLTATTFSVHSARRLAKLVKENNPGIITLVGGPHITAAPDETMRRFKEFDIGILGEGEETIQELLSILGTEGKGEIKNIPGIAFRDGEALVITEPRRFIKEMDNLPFPAWDLLPDFPKGYSPPPFRFRRLPAASIVTSRGCPETCMFCDRAVFGNKCRAFSARYVVEMIRLLKYKYGIRELLIEDDTFPMFKDRLIKICEFLIRDRLNVSWSCLARVNMLDFKILKLMKRAGCWQIGYGIESGSQEILDFANKRIDLKEVEDTIRLTHESGIMSKGFFIMGFPKENEETLRSTIDFATRLRLDDISIAFMTPLPGTRLYSIASQYGQFRDDWGKMSLLEVVFLPHGLTEEKLKKYSRELWKKFYLRPRIIMGYILRIIKNPMAIFRIFKGLTAFARVGFKWKGFIKWNQILMI